ncbi:DUF4238 domain-containing protein [Micromonospora sp. WMMA1949]|uniref:DUF4238 domain-containing protein n=1 Tax=Micromonospora sp. WMMA1949 TaxID=3015162 RepID=UPI0022B6B260|nr:DUF4238 domain-containing protein [Micromonospora sp. WMMA1949]MCZ7429874.1 DUF4238 domain-containing protein [Micromonospora sp. WMMA1949]
MSAQISRDHHTVPKLYLRGFCGTKGPEKGVVLARYRNGHEKLLTIKQATVELDFYDIGDDASPDDSLENWFNNAVENPVGRIMGQVRNGVLPTTTADRRVFARFVAAQMVRTIAFRTLMTDMSSHLGPAIFSFEVLQRAISEDPSLKQDSVSLTRLQQQIADRAPDELRGAGKASMMRNMIREANRLEPLILDMNWLLTYADEPMLVTGDAPVTTLSGTGEIHFMPMVLPELHEIQMPVTPSRLLTITPFPSLGTASELTLEQANRINQSIARSCSQIVLRRPDMSWPADLVLPKARAPLARPHITVSPSDSGHATKRTWPSVVEQAYKEALDLLGGDPDIE